MFAVLRPDDGNEFAVPVCHLNLWMLPGPLGGTTFLDVGLNIESGDSPLKEFRVALPFETHPVITDLRERMVDLEVTRLIWGEPATTIDNNGDDSTLRLSSAVYNLGRIDVDGSTAKNSKATGSVWRIRLSKPLPPRTTRYFRFRFEVRRTGRTWIWKWSGLTRRGAILDFRVSDARESITPASREPLIEDMVDLPEVYFFVILAADYHMQTVSPPLRYVRGLESREWANYLSWPTRGLMDRQKLLVYYWRWSKGRNVGSDTPHKADEALGGTEGKGPHAVTVDAPARAFAAFTRANSVLGSGALIRIAIVVAIAYIMMRAIDEHGVDLSLPGLPTEWVAFLGFTSILGLLALLGILRQSLSWLALHLPGFVRRGKKAIMKMMANHERR